MPDQARHSLDLAERNLGPCELVTASGGQLDRGIITRVRDRNGREYLVKRHASINKHAREVHAYGNWVPALGARAPRLVAADRDAMTILITAVPGHPADSPGSTQKHHRQAGALLRRFHHAEPGQPLPGFQQWLDDRASWWILQAAPILSARDRHIIGGHLAELRALGTPNGGPGHFDFQPRNWLIDQSGTLCVIDFEHSRVGLQARDFTRLYFRYWASDPRLRDAFFDGYQRPLTAAEEQTVIHCGAIDALTALARGTRAGDPALISHGRATLTRLHTGS